MSETCKRHAPLLRYEDACLTATCNGCEMGKAESVKEAARRATAAAIIAYQQSPSAATKEILSDAMFAMESVIMRPDDDPVYGAALRWLFQPSSHPSSHPSSLPTKIDNPMRAHPPQ